MTNINFLLTISIQCQEIRFLEINKNHLRENALIFYQILSTYPFKVTYRDRFEEFVRGYWGLKVKRVDPPLTRMQNALRLQSNLRYNSSTILCY